MPRYTVYECDRCGKKKTDDEIPDDWMFGIVTKSKGDPYALDKRYVWCGSCLRDITKRMAEAG